MAENKGSRTQDERLGLLEALQEIIRGTLKDEEYYSKTAKIVSVNTTDKTCEVSFFDDEPNNEAVRLQNVSSSTGFLTVPAVDSVVIITYLDQNTAFISMYSEIDEVLFQDGTNGGLIKISDLVTKLNNLESEVNNITNLLKTWIVAPTDGGLALKTAAIALFINPLTPTTTNDLENDKFKH